MRTTARSRRCLRASERLALVPLLLVTALTACESRVTLVDPTSGPPTDTTGTVQRATLEVRVVAEPADRGVADALGTTDGRLAGAEVTITRQGSSARLVDTADANGVARFADLLPGTWAVSALRALTTAEVSTLPAGDRDVTAFAGGTQRVLGNGEAGVLELRALAGRRGSLVISQVMPSIPLGPDGNNYFSGQYLQVYNNSDTTVFLDGKLIALGIAQKREYPSPRSCADLAPWRLDSLGIWAGFIYAFPGRGRDHPLLPGRSATVAADALDHRQIVASLADLSGADFEFRGPLDVDNPSVPDMRVFGPREYAPSVHGTGLLFYSIDNVYILADVVDSSLFVRADIPGLVDPEHWRIPASRVLDVVSTILAPSREALLSSRPCAQITLPRFDRQPGDFLDETRSYSFARRTFQTLPDGRDILQRTRTTSQDFILVNGTQPR